MKKLRSKATEAERYGIDKPTVSDRARIQPVPTRCRDCMVTLTPAENWQGESPYLCIAEYGGTVIHSQESTESSKWRKRWKELEVRLWA